MCLNSFANLKQVCYQSKIQILIYIQINSLIIYIMCHFLECVSLMFSLQSDRRCTQTDKLIVLSMDLLHYVCTQIYKYISQGQSPYK